MGIGIDMMEMILREHTYKPIKGDVLMIGRQTVYLTPDELLTTLDAFGIETDGTTAESIEIDQQTLSRKFNKNSDLITDDTLFSILGANKVLALDHTDYEGAEVIHNLNTPLPSELHGVADILVDGSTLDNVFNPVNALKSFNELLRPHGRMLLLNAFSCFDTPYAIMPPLWFIDYFVMNKFADVHVYICLMDPPVDNATASNPQKNIFLVSLKDIHKMGRSMGRFTSQFHMCTLLLAEKGANSTSDVIPTQQDYRSEEEWKVYNENLQEMLTSQRPILVRSRHPKYFFEAKGGHYYVDSEFIQEI